MAGLYLHVPFCRQKCHYCDFFSDPPAGNELESWHLLLQQNLRLIAKQQTPDLDTIFFGGGTPSLLSPEQIHSVLDCCRALFPVCAAAEISLEANPGTLSARALDGYLSAGINRLSLGIQSFDDSSLARLGRRHTAAQARAAFLAARGAGFDNISVDLIFALPGQNALALRQEIRQLLELAPDHVGIYGLSVEAGTQLERHVEQGLAVEADEETYAAHYLLLSRLLRDAGYEHYEISNFARAGQRCRHNQGYWQRKACLAAGAGAHSFEAAGYGERWTIPQDLPLYQKRLAAGVNPAVFLEGFKREQAMAETLYLAMRTSDGLDLSGFARQFGCAPEEVFPAAFQALNGRLQHEAGRCFFGPEEWLIYDHLISHFLSS